ncbi:hypothetical protein TRSC58_07406 [Trypanosoma rangeli SC58]|uniref:Uncharacterized protein n=1 Tax=Trypanosoma rangeli SC58 TaxID=429131 RepID=A0A061ISW1_TRYRA|nr:hypothetical protein TRSC58_07406 [Trypanosoma rangeli SC58]
MTLLAHHGSSLPFRVSLSLHPSAAVRATFFFSFSLAVAEVLTEGLERKKKKNGLFELYSVLAFDVVTFLRRCLGLVGGGVCRKATARAVAGS